MIRNRIGKLLTSVESSSISARALCGRQGAVDHGVDLDLGGGEAAAEFANWRQDRPSRRARLASWFDASTRSCLRAAMAL